MTTTCVNVFDMKLIVSATDFKARCLALLDEMEGDGQPITITRRGHPVAVLSPAPKDAWKSPADSWNGRAEIIGDIVNNDSAALWEVASAN